MEKAPQTEESGFIQDSGGKYHWYYEVNMFTNPTLFITCFKVFGGIVTALGLLLGLLIGEELFGKLKFVLTFWGCGLGLCFVLVGISYCIYALMQGGKYCVVFDMDQKGITHTQLDKQFQKAQVVGAMTTLMGATTGSFTMMGAGLLTASHGSTETKFKLVDRIKVKRHRHVLYIHTAFSWNQIYVQEKYFDEVLEYVVKNVPKTVKIKGIVEIKEMGGV